eukprot:537550_1
MTQKPTQWHVLNSNNLEYFHGPFSMNKDEFLITGTFAENNGFFKYDTTCDKWIKIFDLDTNNGFEYLSINSLNATFDRTNQLLYLCGEQNLYQIDLQKQTIKVLLQNDFIDLFPAIACINNKLHIGCDRNQKHLICDPGTKTVRESQFGFKMLVQHMVDMQSRNSILMFGSDIDDEMDVIYEFSLQNNEWHEWNVELPTEIPISGSCILASANEKYIFILGGYTYRIEEEDCDTITVLDVQNAVLRNCSIKCPKKGEFGGIIVNNKEDDDLLVFGYVNQFYRSGCFNNVEEIPHYLIQLIRNYVCNEFIHLIKKYSSAEHWKIDVDCIISSLI